MPKISQKGPAGRQAGVIHLLPILVILTIVALVGFFLVSRGLIQNPPSSISPTAQYKNPLDKEAQYMNPFAELKNPFDLLK